MREKKQRTMYLPMVQDRPARWDGYQLCVAGGRSFKVELVSSLDKVRQQISRSVENRLRDGLTASKSDYGYVLVGVDA